MLGLGGGCFQCNVLSPVKTLALASGLRGIKVVQIHPENSVRVTLAASKNV